LSSDGNEFRGLLNETTAIEKEKLEIPGTPPAAEGIGIFDQREKISACQFGKLRAQLKNERVIINDFGTPMESAINQSGLVDGGWGVLEPRWKLQSIILGRGWGLGIRNPDGNCNQSVWAGAGGW
jgi:hypothetical protein